MNRLILLGNGFDLAHGMKTGYNDFILWYLSVRINEAIEGEYEDELLKVYPEPYQTRYFKLGDFDETSEIVYHLYKTDELGKFLNNERPLNLKTSLKIEFKSSFLKKLIIDCSINNWVEIENEYYNSLVSLLNINLIQKKKALERLNNDLDIIKSLLEMYLSEIVKTKNIHEFNSLINNDIKKNEISLKADIGFSSERPVDIYILNFNYTSTIEQYSDFKKDKLDVNYIHGKLNDISNPIIFGFGDELDKQYENLELEKTKGFLKHIKSFWYFKTSNYYNLIRFIGSEDYQVVILGHSCGLSDRTMLNMIFEHENCKSIKIYYHKKEDGSDNYTELTEEISRHFKDKGLMRKKIVSKDKSQPMPPVKL